MGRSTSVPTSDQVPEQMYAVASRSAGIPAMADAVSWQRGGDEFRVVKCSKCSQRALHLAQARPRCNNARRGFNGQIKLRENVACPVAGCRIDEASVRGVGVLCNSRCAERVKNELRQAKPGSLRDRCIIGQKLVDAVDSQRLRPGARKASSGGSKLSAFAFAAIVRSSR